MKVVKLIAVSVILAAASACNDQGDDRLSQKAGIEGEAQASAQLEVEKKRALEMEADLAVRHRFYQAVRGTYEGKLKTDDSSYNLRITLVPSLPPYPTSRVRAVSEVVEDLNNLHFNIQVVQWKPGTSVASVGCRVERIKPDLVNGEINIASENCPNFYSIQLAGDKLPVGEPGGLVRDVAVSKIIAADVRDGKLESVKNLMGQVQVTSFGAVYTFSAEKVTP